MGLAADQRVATGHGLVPAGNLGIPKQYGEATELRFNDGSRLRCTPDHQIMTTNRGAVRADALVPTDKVPQPGTYIPRTEVSWALPRSAADVARGSSMALPTNWDEPLAYYLGWLVGDGSFSHRGAVTIYGSKAEVAQLVPIHRQLLASWSGFVPKPSLQANGTVQLRLMRRDFVDFLLGLGLVPRTAAEKVVPDAILTAPEEALTAFLRGLFDADGCIVNDTKKGTRYAGLSSRSEALLVGVQQLLSSLGVTSRIYRTGHKTDSFDYTRKDGSRVTYSSAGPSFDLRITGPSLREFAVTVDFDLLPKQEKLLRTLDLHAFYRVAGCRTLTERIRLERQPVAFIAANVI